MAVTKQSDAMTQAESTLVEEAVQSATAADEAAVVRKVALRLIPFLFFLYVIAYLDRVNVGFAKLQMGEALKINEEVYGAGAGIFFLGYFLFEVPSNLILQRMGARRWIARIMFTWGAIAMGMALVNSVPTFFGLRFLLGIAEAGFFPGMLLYLTYWFTAKERAKVVAWFMTANAVSFIVGGPLSGWLMTAKILPNLAGWQQMFILEGLPAVLMGFVVLRVLPDGPQEASWLTPLEKEIVMGRVAAESGATTERGARTERDGGRAADDHGSFAEALRQMGMAFRQPVVVVFCTCFFFFVSGMYGLSLWIPQIVKQIGNLDNLQTGLLTALPFLVSGTVMVANGYHSDYTGERPLHIFVPALFGAAGLVVYGIILESNPPLALLALSVAASGMWAMLGPFWAMVPGVLRRAATTTSGGAVAVAGGLALINSVGNLGGFLGPWAVGLVKDLTKTFSGGVFLLAGFIVVGAVLALVAGRMTASPASESR